MCASAAAAGRGRCRQARASETRATARQGCTGRPSALCHLRKQALLPPGWRTGVEEWRAGLQEAQVVGGEDALALVALFQHVEAVLSRDGRAAEIAGAWCESVRVRLPPALHPRRIGPRQPIILIHFDIRIVRVVVRSGL